MLTIHVPACCPDETAYVFDLIFKRYWGIDYNLCHTEQDRFRIETGEGALHMPCVLFRQLQDQGKVPAVLPALPLLNIPLDDEELRSCCLEAELPVIYGRSDNDLFLRTRDNSIYLGVDIPGSVIFMLSRLEELICDARDEHDRFPVESALACRAGFLHRPIINEYLEVLWTLLHRLNPTLDRKSLKFRMNPGHDIDVPFMAYRTGIRQFLRYFFSELNTRRRLDMLLPLLKGSLQAKCGLIQHDPFFTFDYIMTQSEKRDIHSRFFLIVDSGASHMDGTYAIEDPEITILLTEIQNRGHEIALHCSYQTCLDGERIKNEFMKLQDCCRKLGISQEISSSRQHYLRFHVADTWRLLDQAGIQFDESLAFAGSPGFRCGICYEFPVYDLQLGRQLDLLERPLIAMDSSILLKRYSGSNAGDQGLDSLIQLKKACKRYNGTFNLLWHNNHLSGAREREMYEMLLDA